MPIYTVRVSRVSVSYLDLAIHADDEEKAKLGALEAAPELTFEDKVEDHRVESIRLNERIPVRRYRHTQGHWAHESSGLDYLEWKPGMKEAEYVYKNGRRDAATSWTREVCDQAVASGSWTVEEILC